MKGGRKTTWCMLLGTIFVTVSLVRTVDAGDDWEYWGSYKVSKKINDNLKLIWEPKMQVRDDMSNFYYAETVQGISYKLSDHFDLGLFYLYAWAEVPTRRDVTEHRLRTQVTWHTKIGGGKISNRSRYEYREIEGDGRHRYRNRIQFSKAVTIFDHKITPYMSNEFFWSITEGEYVQNRVAVGFSREITDHVKGGLYYMLRSDRKGSDWNERNIIGSKIDIAL